VPSILSTSFPSYQLGRQIMESLENARLALTLEDPLLHQWVPHLKKEKGEGRKEFLRGIVLAADAARAAYDAGYRDEPIPDACDILTGLCAYIALLLRDEIMARILDGTVPAYDATIALAVLNRFDSNPQSLENAAWFISKLEDRH